MEATIACPSCGEHLGDGARWCPSCGRPVRRLRIHPGWWSLLGAFVAFNIGFWTLFALIASVQPTPAEPLDASEWAAEWGCSLLTGFLLSTCGAVVGGFAGLRVR